MKLIAAILLSAIALHAQFGNATRLQSRPLAATAPNDTNVICWDSATTTWKPCAVSAGGTPGSPVSSIQYNNAGSFGGMSGTAWTNATRNLAISDANSNLLLDFTANPSGGGASFDFFALNPDSAAPPSVATQSGTDGADIVIRTPKGGASSRATTGAGGAAGTLNLRASAGGAAILANTASTGGNGGTVDLFAGVGAAAPGLGTNNGGVGGTVYVGSGSGGSATGGATNNGGNGGDIDFQNGTGGAGASAAGRDGRFVVHGGGSDNGPIQIWSALSGGLSGVYVRSDGTLEINDGQGIGSAHLGPVAMGSLSIGTSVSINGTTGIATSAKLGNAAFSLLTGAGKFSSGVPVGQAACADLSDAGSGCSATAGANAALSNLASVSINTSLLAQTGVDLGSTAKPFRDLYLFGSGTFATTYLKITGTPTSTRTWTLPDASDTFAGLGISQTFSGNNIFSANGALSSGAGPGAKFNGTWITGGTGTTTKPYVLIETTGATSTGWNTSGTGLGINAATGFGGMLVDLKVNGSSTLNIDSTGKLVSVAGIQGSSATGGSAGVISTRTDSNAFSARGVAGGFALDTANPTGGYCWNGAVQFTQDTCLHRNAAGIIEFNSGTKGTITGGAKLRQVEHTGTIPGISGCSAGTQTGGNTAGTFTSGTAGACTVVLTFAVTATTGWFCAASDRTTPANLISQSASSTTTCTVTGTTLSGDVIGFTADAY